MKVTQIFIISLLLMTFAFSAYAQPNEKGWDKKEIKYHHSKLDLPDLSDEQKEQIKSLKTAGKKEMIQLKNTVGELNAKLRTLQTADKPDMNMINSTIDEISVIKTDMEKKKAAHQQAIRSLLTEEQRVVFDSRPDREMKGKGRGHGRAGHGFHKRDCNCRK